MSGLQLPVVLIGPMAAGKSSIGRYLARHYGLGFVDADAVIVKRHGPIPELFTTQGEAKFREIEAQIVAELLADPEYRQHVISLGGGAPMNPTVQRALEGHTVAYIQVDLATVRPRISGNTTRPMLQPDPQRRWSEIFEQRRPTFERLATITLDATGRRSVARVAQQLYGALNVPGKDQQL